MLKNGKQQDIRCIYKITGREWVRFLLEANVAVLVIAYFFYRSLIAYAVCLPLLLILIKQKKKECCQRKKVQLTLQFKELMISLNGSIQAGYSLENAFLKAIEEMKMFFGSNSMIVTQLYWIREGMKNNQPVEKLVFELGKRSEIEDIRDFAELLVIAKQTGGNLQKMIRTSVAVLEEKAETLKEIETMMSAKKFEQNIMNAVPFFLILYVEMTSKGFFAVLYHNPGGIIFMTFCLLLYCLSYCLAKRIVSISM